MRQVKKGQQTPTSVFFIFLRKRVPCSRLSFAQVKMIVLSSVVGY